MPLTLQLPRLVRPCHKIQKSSTLLPANNEIIHISVSNLQIVHSCAQAQALHHARIKRWRTPGGAASGAPGWGSLAHGQSEVI